MGVWPDSVVADNLITLATAQIIGAQLVFTLSTSLAHESGYKSSDDFNDYLRRYIVTDNDLQRLTLMAREKGRDYPAEALSKDTDYLKSLIKAEIAQMIWNNRDNYYRVLISEDTVVKSALSLFPLAQMTARHWHQG
jgi:hypothetical protein